MRRYSMEKIKLDCQGLPCPKPVLKCKETISHNHPAQIKVLVDNEAAKQNVTRFLKSQKYLIVSCEQKDSLYELEAEPENGTVTDQAEPKEVLKETIQATEKTEIKKEYQQLVLITSDVIGHGDDVLGAKLMQNFIATLPEMGDSLWRIILINAGVKLAIQGSQVLEQLQELEKSGISILVCGTCLDHFKLLEKKRVGETTNMLDVVTSLQLASKVIKI